MTPRYAYVYNTQDKYLHLPTPHVLGCVGRYEVALLPTSLNKTRRYPCVRWGNLPGDRISTPEVSRHMRHGTCPHQCSYDEWQAILMLIRCFHPDPASLMPLENYPTPTSE